MKFLRIQKGATLLEVMLALAIASAILVSSIKMYQRFKLQSDLTKVQSNVDLLFAAMGNYYRAQCPIGGTLDPATAGTTNSFPVTNGTAAVVTTAMQAYGLAVTLGKNSLLDDVGNTYVLQFNPSLSTTSPQVNACVVMVPGTACIPTSSTLPSSAKSLIWTAQVAVKLKDSTKGPVYQSSLGADCLSAGHPSTNPTTIDPCSNPDTHNTYLVWERLPSYTAPNTTSILWLSMPQLKQFNLQYTHDQMYELSDTGAVRSTYYLCGG
ncbi:MAG: hypothetical protein P4M12_00535 [Gammaproteobacteria bacterium]|nr:hypothetical protein [Gammaproteobacteria bacterium]